MKMRYPNTLLRLSVLQKYGGVWMDATVFCSGFWNEKLQGRWNRIMQSELTVFRYFKRGTMAPVVFFIPSGLLDGGNKIIWAANTSWQPYYVSML